MEALVSLKVDASFKDQRLETLRHAFLRFATTVHVSNKSPYENEGYILSLGQDSVQRVVHVSWTRAWTGAAHDSRTQRS